MIVPPWETAPDPAAARFPLADVPARGLAPAQHGRKRVLVLGAGVAGLTAAYELQRQGHDPLVLEARRRVGGRIHTAREFAPGLIAELGAMRIPRIHETTLGYCRAFGLPLRPGVAYNPRALAHVAGRRVTLDQAEADPAAFGFPLAEHERGRTREQMWREATDEVRELIHQNADGGSREALTAKYDSYSIRGFLKAQGWSDGAVERYGVMTFTESTLGTGVMQEFREVFGGAYRDVVEIVDGMDRLPAAFYERLKARIRFGAEVYALEQDGAGVTARVRIGADRVSFTGDYAICTLPFSVLRGVDADPAFSAAKQRAIRQLHYDAATKIFFQVRRPFWERTDGIRGGTTVTDLPVRRIVYPAHPRSAEDRAVLLASYTWGQDALQWSALDADQRVERALRDVGRIHPQIAEEFEGGISYCWYRDPYAMGAYALFEPEQQSTLQEAIREPEGRIHFAGEHCSSWPAWIEGAVESGIGAAHHVHTGQPLPG